MFKAGDEVRIKQSWGKLDSGIVVAVADKIAVRCDCGFVFDYPESALKKLVP